MGEPVFLAVDSGTTRMKAALMDGCGRLRALAGEGLPVRHPADGECETDPEAVWEALCGLVRRLEEASPESWPDLAGLAIAGQGDGLWALDRAGRPVRPAILWNDTRTKRLEGVDWPGLEAFCAARALTALFPGAGPALLLWLRRREPDHHARTAHLVHCKDWLNYNLTGVVGTDFSDASTAALDVLERRYVGELFDRLGLPGAQALLPEPRPSASLLGRVTRAAAERTGLPEGLPVMAGALDVAAVAAGAGAAGTGDAVTVVGTTLCNEVALERAQVDPAQPGGSTLCHALPDRWLRLMATSSGTSSLDWARRQLAPERPFQQLEADLARIPPGCEGVLFQPYLHGERAPFRNPLACGGFFGLTARHTPLHMLRAAYEGLALAFLDCHRFLPKVDRVVLAGGGAASDLLCQLFADCLGRPMVRPGFPELGLAGAAGLAWTGLGGTGRMPLQETAASREFTPEPGRHAFYERLYALSGSLRTVLEPVWAARDRLYGTAGCPDPRTAPPARPGN